MLDGVRQRAGADRSDERVRHPLRDLVHGRARHHVAALPFEPGLLREMCAGRIEAHDALLAIDHQQAPADVHRGGGDHAPVLDQAKLGRAAADVHVENARLPVVRHARGSGAVGGEHRLHVVPRGRADEFAALLRDDPGDRFGVLAAQRFAGQNHHAGVDVVGVQPRAVVRVVDDRAEARLVDALLARVRRERDGRLVQRLARRDDVAARKVLAEPAQLELGEDHLRAGGADVDPDAAQRHVIGDPERVLLERTGILEVVVVVIGVLAFRVHVVEPLSVQVVVQAVRARGLGVVVGHCGVSVRALRAR